MINTDTYKNGKDDKLVEAINIIDKYLVLNEPVIPLFEISISKDTNETLEIKNLFTNESFTLRGNGKFVLLGTALINYTTCEFIDLYGLLPTRTIYYYNNQDEVLSLYALSRSKYDFSDTRIVTHQGLAINLYEY